MIYPTRSQTSLLVLGLALALAATAQEPKAPKSDAEPAALKSTKAAEPNVPKSAKVAASVENKPVAEPVASISWSKPPIAPKLPERKSIASVAETVTAIKPGNVTHAAKKLTEEAALVRKPARHRGAMISTAEAKKAEPPPAAPAHAESLHWSYEGAGGPKAWAKLAPEYAKCGNGERQSPIDIRDGMKVDLEPIMFEYRPSGFKVIDNGHTIQANVGGWNAMRVMGRRFKLVQFHFHRPSEETIDGKQFEMVVHLVHKDSEDRLAVVAVLVEGGARQPAIQAVLNNLPLEKGQEVAGTPNLDLNQMLPENRRYYTYMGSLTTPPCTEDVLWIVMKQPVQASAEQLELFSRMYPMNARPTQAAGNRTIKESN